jgi:hypothetical protein
MLVWLLKTNLKQFKIERQVKAPLWRYKSIGSNIGFTEQARTGEPPAPPPEAAKRSETEVLGGRQDR